MEGSPMKRSILIIPLLFVFALAGCQIPLFSTTARPLNRIASANEVITELNGKLVDYRTNGWLTQAQINSTYGPALDKATAAVDEAEALYRATGSTPDLNAKLDAVAAQLQTLRASLQALQRSKQ